ncbi:MAG: hypothetical protein HKN19_11965 [Halioglobus sp.]|nr:hypothetical protein [Halioglobus sp.]
MNNLFLLLLAIFGGVALMVVVGERVLKPMEPEAMAKLSRWIYPLVGLALVISIARYYLG